MPRPSPKPVRRLPRPEPVNFAQLLIELRGHGWTMRAIAQALGVTRSRVERWLTDGCAPRHDDGEALIALHRRVTAEAAEERVA